MDREYYRHDKIDRSSWESGPWDNEPDYFEWTTGAGYPAWAGRLSSGAWFGIVEAPHPAIKDDGWSGRKDFMEFSDVLHNKRRNQMEHQFGMVSKTDKENVGGFTFSMEHWESPGPSNREWHRGPYKTLEELKKICEDVAQDIYETNRYFELKAFW